MPDKPLPKANAMALISIQTNKSRRTIDAAIKTLTERGVIHPEKSPYATVILFSQEDIAAVVAYLTAPDH